MRSKHSRIWLIIASLLAFFLLTTLLYGGHLTNLDHAIDSQMQSLRHSSLTSVCIFIDRLFDPLPIIIFSIIIFLAVWLKHSKRLAIFFAGAMLADGIIVEALKYLVHRPRPLDAIILVDGFSFPSGHAASALVLFGFLAYMITGFFKSRSKRWFVLGVSIFIILSVGFSRIYLGVHWPSDVLAGYAIGLSIFLSSLWLAKVVLVKRKKHIITAD